MSTTSDTAAPTVPRLPADTTAETLTAALRDHGVAIVERLASEELCDRVAAELAPHLEVTPTGGDDFTGANTRRTGALLHRVPSSVDLVAHPLILDAADAFLWGKKTTFQLHLTQAIALGPDAEAQFLHRDQWCFDFFPFPDDVEVELSTIWALTDFTEANGATRVVPGSHRDHDVSHYRPEHTVPAEMPRGSVVVYSGRTVHGGGHNTTDSTRIGINVDYVLGWLRQEENQYLSVPIERVKELPERVQRLLGYEMGAYALGYIDDVRSPMTLLRDEGAVGGAAGSSFLPDAARDEN